MVYEGKAFLIHDNRPNSTKIINLRTRSIKIGSVDANGVARGETSGFLHGANWILGLVKGTFDAELVQK